MTTGVLNSVMVFLEKKIKTKTEKEETMKKLVFLLAACVLLTSIPKSGFARQEKDVTTLIEHLEVGESVYYRNLTLVPVYNTKIKDWTPYVTLDEALKKKWIGISEVEGGQVPKVRIRNKSNKTIFLMGGEVITGCKQDRILGRDVLLGPKCKDVIVPVYCVEQGRWSYQSKTFSSRENLGTSKLRAEAQMGKNNTQANIWSDVSNMQKKMKVSSRTSNYQHIYDKPEIKKEVGCFEKELHDIPQLQKDTVGVIVGVGGKIISVDIFCNMQVFQKKWPKILKASAFSAISSEDRGTVTQEASIHFLQKLHDKTFFSRKAIDLGRECYVEDSEVNVNALVYRNAVIHLAGFPQSDTNVKEEQRIPVLRR